MENELLSEVSFFSDLKNFQQHKILKLNFEYKDTDKYRYDDKRKIIRYEINGTARNGH
jgi:hypothetical protein